MTAQDVGFAMLLKRYRDAGYGSRTRAKLQPHSTKPLAKGKGKAKAANGKEIAEADSDSKDAQLKDGHLILAEYLFSLAYFSLFRKNEKYTPALRKGKPGKPCVCSNLTGCGGLRLWMRREPCVCCYIERLSVCARDSCVCSVRVRILVQSWKRSNCWKPCYPDSAYTRCGISTTM